jgi:hypothetical protein
VHLTSETAVLVLIATGLALVGQVAALAGEMVRGPRGAGPPGDATAAR